MLRLKSGESLLSDQFRYRITVLAICSLVLVVLLPVKFLAIGRNVDPQAAFPADGAGALNHKSDLVARRRRWR